MNCIFVSASIYVILFDTLAVCKADQHNIVVETTNPEEIQFGEAKAPRYLLYDVNPGEGFNLRRDVYLRIANLVWQLNEDSPWILVLPPWGRLYHWKSRHIDQIRIPWSTFFDLPSLRLHVPVIEFSDFLTLLSEPVIDEVYYLQNYKEGWEQWEEKMDIGDCNEDAHYQKDTETGLWDGWFFGYQDEVSSRDFQCVSVQGNAGYLKPFLLNHTTARSVMIDRAETVLHDRFGDADYWKARRSVVFAKHLRDIGDKFRETYLNSTDTDDKTVSADDWTTVNRKHGEAVGGPFIGVHLRRADFKYARPDAVPTLKSVAKQLKKILEKHDLSTVFIATDDSQEKFEQLKEYLSGYEVYRYSPPVDVHKTYKDGGVAIIDQWICAHARYFIGTHESTFSFRIQEEREILGFNPEMTFNCFCGKKDKTCEQPSKWTIVY